MPYLLFLVITPTSILKLRKTKIEVACSTPAFSYALWNMHIFTKHAYTVSVSQNPRVVQSEEGNWAAQYLGTTDTSTRRTDSIPSVWEVLILSM